MIKKYVTATSSQHLSSQRELEKAVLTLNLNNKNNKKESHCRRKK
jgi:hypothetical protein